MPINLNAYLGVHADALKIRSERTEVLARNLANADTPGYQARDLDFKAALAQASGSPGAPIAMTTTHPNQISNAIDASGATTANLKYRIPLAPALDGNTVDVQMEQANFAENSVRFQATLTFLSGSFRGLMTAITGQ